MMVVCVQCGKKGILDEHSYSGKTLRLRCPYCFQDFMLRISGNGEPALNQAVSISNMHGEQSSALAMSGVEAFVDSMESEALILEAKRIARLIISEIKLYNHDKIEKAASKREVLEILKTDLMRGKQHYNSRIAAKLQTGPDYFMETVKEILLAGKS